MWNSKEISSALNVNLPKKINFSDICIDSRNISKNSLFFPIIGERFDGHNYINEALNNGAIASIVNQGRFKKNEIRQFKDKLLIPVENSLISLAQLAIYSRTRAKNMTMLCITGSNGKTSVKNWLKRILEKQIKTHSTEGNLNNHIGMPLSLSKMNKNTEACILEIGMNKPGEIQYLSDIASPDISIITNIGPAHLGNFNSIEEIAEEKSCIFQRKKNSIAIIPRDSIYYNLIKKRAIRKCDKVFSFGEREESDFQLVNSRKISYEISELELRIFNEVINVKTQTHSLHFHLNILLVLIVSNLLKLNLKKTISDILNLSPSIGRGIKFEIKSKGKNIILIDESYNSNPVSLAASIDNLNIIADKQKRKICIIGDMLELGKNSKKMHKDIVKLILKNKIDIVFTFGTHSKLINDNLPSNIFSKHFEDLNILYNNLSMILLDGDIVMVKGSNSLNLNKVCAKLKENLL